MTIFTKVDFETGDLSQIIPETTGDGVIEIVSHGLTGNYCARAYGSSGHRARIYPAQGGIGPGNLTKAHVRILFHPETLGTYIEPIRFAGQSIINGGQYYIYLMQLLVRRNTITAIVGMTGKNIGDWHPIGETAAVAIAVDYRFDDGKTYCIEAKLDLGDALNAVPGNVSVWVGEKMDDKWSVTQVIDYTAILPATSNIDSAFTGNILDYAATGITISALYDDFVQADNYIGPPSIGAISLPMWLIGIPIIGYILLKYKRK